METPSHGGPCLFRPPVPGASAQEQIEECVLCVAIGADWRDTTAGCIDNTVYAT
jgi:hypothetical protein